MKATVLLGDALLRLKEIPDCSVQCCVTSPPYWNLRDYHVEGQIGMEKDPEQYIANLCAILDEVWRVLCDDGTLWLNLGDSYASKGGHSDKNCNDRRGRYGISSRPEHTYRAMRARGKDLKPKDLVGIPWMAAFALRKKGWYLRSEIIWAKPNGMPGSQEDRCTSSHETIFLFSKRHRYYSDFDAIKTPPRESSMVRLAQDVQAQAGSHRANAGAKTNGPMKAVQHKSDKQRGHIRKHAGFNERWDQMTVAEQQSTPAMMRDVWFVPPAQFRGEHFAVMPDEIARRCVLAGSRENDTVLDPFCGRGTTGIVALRYGREFVGIDLNPAHINMSREAIQNSAPLFNEVLGDVSTPSSIPHTA